MDRPPAPPPLLVAADAARAALLATIPLAAFLGTLTIAQLMIVSLLAGVARVFFDVGYQSYLPSVVGRAGLLHGNAAMETVRACGQVAGPGAGGWAVTVLGAANVVLAQAVTFAVSAASLLAIRAPEPPPRPRQGSLVAEVGEGLAFVARTRVLRATAITSAAGNFSFAIASAASFVFMVRTLGLAPGAIGLVLAAGSLAALAGAALTPRLARRVGSARVIWLSLAVTGPVGLLGPWRSRAGRWRCWWPARRRASSARSCTPSRTSACASACAPSACSAGSTPPCASS
ncbi:MFS transporter [Nonomuraea thailandensis]